MKVTLQVFAYREPSLTETLDALAAQNVPENVHLDREVWVTPSGPLETCGTWRQAEANDHFRARVAPEGKLSSRNVAHDTAFGSGADVVVSWDADAPPMSTRTLSSLLGPFSDGDVSATYGRQSFDGSLMGMILSARERVGYAVLPRLPGRCSAFTAEAWEEYGPFSEDLDQTNIQKVWVEEEMGFHRAASGVGRVVSVPEARIYGSKRRAMCTVHDAFPGGSPSYCERIGGETFQPVGDDRRWR